MSNAIEACCDSHVSGQRHSANPNKKYGLAATSRSLSKNCKLVAIVTMDGLYAVMFSPFLKSGTRPLAQQQPWTKTGGHVHARAVINLQQTAIKQVLLPSFHVGLLRLILSTSVGELESAFDQIPSSCSKKYQPLLLLQKYKPQLLL